MCGPENRAQSSAGADALLATSEPSVGAGIDNLTQREGSAARTQQTWPRQGPGQKGKEAGSGRVQLRERRARCARPLPTKKLLYGVYATICVRQ